MHVEPVRVGLFQGPLTTRGAAAPVNVHLAAIAAAAHDAAGAGAHLLVTPEMSATGYDIGELISARAEPADGSIFEAIADIATREGIAVVYGYPECDAGSIYNSAQVVSREGRSLARYRKTHLYGPEDRAHFRAGETLVAGFDFEGVRCGLLICYDVEFPEAVRAHADAGTEWLIVPTALMTPFEMVARQVVPTRAFESHLQISYVNRCGSEDASTYCGLSCSITADGVDLARAGAGEELLFADIVVADQSRNPNTHLADRRTDLYRSTAVRGGEGG